MESMLGSSVRSLATASLESSNTPPQQRKSKAFGIGGSQLSSKGSITYCSDYSLFSEVIFAV